MRSILSSFPRRAARSLTRSYLFGTLAAAALAAPVAAQSPCVNPNALLDTIRSIDGRTNFLFQGGHGAFFPQETYYDGKNLTKETNQVYLVLSKGGSVVNRWTMLAEKSIGVFCRYRTVGPPATHDFKEPGDYTLSVAIDDKTLTTLPFHVEIKDSGDPFDPKKSCVIDCDLFHWAQIRVRDPKSSSGGLEVNLHLRGGDYELPKGEKIEVFIENQGQKAYRACLLYTSPSPRD